MFHPPDFKVEYTENTRNKLNINQFVATLRIRKEDSIYESDLIEISQNILKEIQDDSRAVRGSFNLQDGFIKLYSRAWDNVGYLRYTFTFDIYSGRNNVTKIVH